MYEDKTLICKECGAEFIFTAGEQEFYASKGFEMSLKDVKHVVIYVKMQQEQIVKCM